MIPRFFSRRVLNLFSIRQQDFFRKRRARQRAAELRRAAELMEDRTLLATITWDGGAGSFNWNDTDNWDTDSIPTALDDAVLGDLASLTFTHQSA